MAITIVPNQKIVGKQVFKIIYPTKHLLCFVVSKTPIVPTVWDENQFGTAKVSIKATGWLCVPATMRIVTKKTANQGSLCQVGAVRPAHLAEPSTPRPHSPAR